MREESKQPGDQKALARQARLVSIVIAGTMVLWVALQWLGGRLGLPERYVFLLDLFALAGFLWALIVTLQIWRRRRDNN
ncbi:MAG: DUF5337 domain-containing protein [Boseongicola sp.]